MMLFVASAHAVGLALSDFELELSGKAGSVIREEILVQNTNPGPVEVRGLLEDWWFQDTGHLFLPASSHERSMSAWLSVSPQSTVLESGESLTFTVHGRVPPEIDAGSYFSIAKFKVQSRSGLGLAVSMGTVLSYTVDGAPPPETSFDGLQWGLAPDGRDGIALSVHNASSTTMDRATGKLLFRDAAGQVVTKLVTDPIRLMPGQHKKIWLHPAIEPGLYTVEGVLDGKTGRAPITSRVHVTGASEG